MAEQSNTKYSSIRGQYGHSIAIALTAFTFGVVAWAQHNRISDLEKSLNYELNTIKTQAIEMQVKEEFFGPLTTTLGGVTHLLAFNGCSISSSDLEKLRQYDPEKYNPFGEGIPVQIKVSNSISHCKYKLVSTNEIEQGIVVSLSPKQAKDYVRVHRKM